MIKSVNLFGKNVEVNVFSDAEMSVFDEVFVDKDYKICDEIIKGAKNCIIDVGAHFGFFSIYSAMFNLAVRIFSFEVEEKNYLNLKENLKLNHLKNVFAKNVGIAGADGEKNLYLSEDSHNHSFVKISDKRPPSCLAGGLSNQYRERAKRANSNELMVRKVNCVSLETVFRKYLARENISFCDLLKMDCEGAEFEIFEKISSEILKKIGNFYIEYHEFLPEMRHESICEKLKQNGFLVKTTLSFYDKRMGFILARRRL